MVTYRVFKNIYSVEKTWKAIVKDDDDDIYQTYKFNLLCYKHRKTSLTNIYNGNTATYFVVTYYSGTPVCLAPLLFDKKPRETIRILGWGTNAGYLDFIYRSAEYVEPTLKKCFKLFNGVCFDFALIKSSSPLNRLMTQKEQFKNYAIHLEDHNDWFNSLSKSTRQNIRTAYNRMETDGLNYDLKIYNNKSPNLKSHISELNGIYQKRAVAWRGEDGLLSPLRQKIFLHRDVIFKSMICLSNSKIAVLYVDGKAAAFFMGLEYSTGIYIPRLAIDTDYSRYSPGILLINEFLKQLSIEGKGYIFDLCRGDEQYKKTMHGEMTLTYRLVRNEPAGQTW